MENKTIEQLEEKVISLTTELNYILKHIDSRTADNYNHLGTLSVNLKVLRNQTIRVIEKLGYR